MTSERLEQETFELITYFTQRKIELDEAVAVFALLLARTGQLIEAAEGRKINPERLNYLKDMLNAGLSKLEPASTEGGNKED